MFVLQTVLTLPLEIVPRREHVCNRFRQQKAMALATRLGRVHETTCFPQVGRSRQALCGISRGLLSAPQRAIFLLEKSVHTGIHHTYQAGLEMNNHTYHNEKTWLLPGEFVKSKIHTNPVSLQYRDYTRVID